MDQEFAAHEDVAEPSTAHPSDQPRALRDYQQQALDRLRQSIAAGCRRPLLQAPTGAGKTALAAAVVRGALEKSKRVCFTVPALSLIDQTVEAFWIDGIRDVGVIQAQHIATDWSRPVQVASVQTLMRRPYPEASIVIIDEAHRWFDHYETWMSDPAWAGVPFIGLSATPWTKGLGKFFDDLIIACTTQELIDSGYLSDFRVFAPAHPDLSQVKTVAGDYHEGQLGEAMNKSPLVADIVQTWIERGEGRPTLCFAVDCAHAKHIQERFEQAGIPCGYQDAYTKDDERKEIRRKFHSGEYKVVANVGTLTTGVDWDVRCIIFARPTKSEILFVQIIGRGLRTAEGKSDCLILDHSDNHLRLGFVTDIQHEHLNDGTQRTKAEPSKPLPKECPKCTFLRPPRISTCPNCGYVPEAPVTKISPQDGELQEMRRTQHSHDAAPGFLRFGTENLSERDFHAQLRGYAAAHGYKSGWAAHKFKEKAGRFPPFGWNDLMPQTPGWGVAGWIKSRQIAYAKAKQKQAAGPSLV